MRKIVWLLSAALLIIGCRQQQEEENTVKDFETMVVSRTDITLEQSYPASIEGRQSVKIIPRVEGYLRSVRIKEGQRVRRGQVLFVLDQATYRAEVKSAAANVAVAKAGIDNAQLNYDSRKNLREKNIVSDYDLRTAASNLAMAKAQAQQAAAQLESARSNLSYTVLRSPSDGVVGSLPYRVGDYVGPNMQDGLTTIADSREVYVYFSLTESDVMRRMEGNGSLSRTAADFPPVTLKLVNGSLYSKQGRVESISGVVESSTGAVTARAVFPNTDGLLLSGGTGSIIIPYKMKQVIVIPQTATFEIQDKVYVYKVVDGRAQSVIVSVMPMSDGHCYIVTDGLVAGETIVSKGASYVKEGQEIHPKQALR